MRENERPESNARAEAAMAMKTLLIVLLSTMLLPRVLLLPLSATEGAQGWAGGRAAHSGYHTSKM